MKRYKVSRKIEYKTHANLKTLNYIKINDDIKPNIT